MVVKQKSKIKQKPTPGAFKPSRPFNAPRPQSARRLLYETRNDDARHGLVRAFTEALYDDFEEHGAEAIEACRLLKPDAYVKIIASLLPKEVTVATESSMSNDELKSAIRRYLSGDFAKLVAGSIGGIPKAVQGTGATGSAQQVIDLSPLSEANGISRGRGDA